jgi:DNA-binding response OmpR family regulator
VTEAAAERVRLLALDDNLDCAELIARIATKCGYEARAIVDPAKLSAMLNEWHPEVITLDLCMPQEDGIGVLTMLQDGGFSGRLIIISGQDNWLRKVAGRLAEARGLKVANDLTKPVDIKVLREYLAELNPVTSGNESSAP